VNTEPRDGTSGTSIEGTFGWPDTASPSGGSTFAVGGSSARGRNLINTGTSTGEVAALGESLSSGSHTGSNTKGRLPVVGCWPRAWPSGQGIVAAAQTASQLTQSRRNQAMASRRANGPVVPRIMNRPSRRWGAGGLPGRIVREEGGIMPIGRAPVNADRRHPPERPVRKRAARSRIGKGGVTSGSRDGSHRARLARVTRPSGGVRLTARMPTSSLNSWRASGKWYF